MPPGEAFPGEDDARLDVDQIVAKALREFERPHVRVLDLLVERAVADARSLWPLVVVLAALRVDLSLREL